jgi:hypothetical protein
MFYAHDGLQPALFQLPGHGFPEDVPFAAGLSVEDTAPLGEELERPSTELPGKRSRGASPSTTSITAGDFRRTS